MATPSLHVVSSGDSDSRVLLHVPHASRHIPRGVRAHLLLSPAALALELDRVTDTLTDVMALEAAAAARCRPWVLTNGLSRLVADPERYPDDREIMNRVGQGVVYDTTSQGTPLRRKDPGHRAHLIAQYFVPYTEALAALVRQRVAAVGRVTILDIHSYRVAPHPNDVNHGQPRPAVCIGTDAIHTPPALREMARLAFSSLGDVRENEPYAGTYVPMECQGASAQVTSIMLELRADTQGDTDLRATAGLRDVVAALTRVIDQLSNDDVKASRRVRAVT